MNKIQLELDSSAWRGVVWDGKKIINRANLNLVRLMIMNLVQDFELSDKEKEQLKDLFISATNFEGDTDSVWDKIMEIKKHHQQILRYKKNRSTSSIYNIRIFICTLSI